MTEKRIAAYAGFRMKVGFSSGGSDPRSTYMPRRREPDDADMANRILLSEQKRKCYYCRTPLVRYVDEANNILGESTAAGKPLDLRETLNEHGYQLRDFVALCPNCGYWIGHGTREIMHGPHMARLIEGYFRQFDIASLDVPVEALIQHLTRNFDDLLHIDPFKAEDVVCNLLREHLHCDVRKIGGRKDGGIDAYIVEAEQVSTIVQVKWRRDNHGGEGVRVVRELVGTLIGANVPNGFLVTTKNHLTPAAMEYARNAGRSSLTTRALRIDYRCYEDLISMLALPSATLGFTHLPENVLARSAAQWFCIFD